jgi:KipI family sensor histidine kinase inhibitor
MDEPFAIVDYGDSGLLVELRAEDHEARWSQAQGIARALERTPIKEVVDVVATYEHVLVSFDPVFTDVASLTRKLRRAVLDMHGDTTAPERRTFTVPVLYGGEHGADLEDVAAELGLTTEEVIARHTSSTWRVRFRASPVATPFMDGASWPRPVSRMAVPRTRVTPGSVALSGHQCVIYPVASPGGWRLIGQTPSRLVDANLEGISHYRAGDSFRFLSVDPDTFADLEADGRWLTPDTGEAP